MNVENLNRMKPDSVKDRGMLRIRSIRSSGQFIQNLTGFGLIRSLIGWIIGYSVNPVNFFFFNSYLTNFFFYISRFGLKFFFII